MNLIRDPSEKERALLAALLKGKPEAKSFLGALDDVLVEQMDDGGMGSLLLVPRSSQHWSRSFGQQLVLGEFTDRDGVSVSVAVNVDNAGNLYELDMWKVNFAPLVAWPDPAQIKIVG